MARLRLAVMGSAGFAVPTLDALVAAGHEIAAVYTRPPRPKGRGQREQRSPVHARADELGIPVRTPKTLRDAAEQAAFVALGLDAAVVAAYGLILPAAVLAAPRLGCLNVHASLLPRWRGAAPIARAIMAGDGASGVTIMRMDEGLDTGPMLLREAVPIGPRTTAGELHDALAALGARLFLEALAGVASGTLAALPQPTEGATYAAKLQSEEERLDWTAPAVALERRIRAFAPRPGAWFARAGERIKVLAAEVVAAPAGAPPGTVLDGRLTIACGEAALRPLTVQRPGRAPLAADAFLRGYPVAAGERLEAGSVPSRPDTASAKA